MSVGDGGGGEVRRGEWEEGRPQGPVYVCVCTCVCIAVDVISEFDSLSALPDLRQISQSE